MVGERDTFDVRVRQIQGPVELFCKQPRLTEIRNQIKATSVIQTSSSGSLSDRCTHTTGSLLETTGSMGTVESDSDESQRR